MRERLLSRIVVDSSALRVYANGGYVVLTRQQFIIFHLLWKKRLRPSVHLQVIYNHLYAALPNCDQPSFGPGCVLRTQIYKIRQQISKIGIKIKYTSAGYMLVLTKTEDDLAVAA